MKTSIIFYPNKNKKNSKTGRVPIYMRVILGRQKAETRLDADLTETELVMWDEFTMRMRDRKHRLNGYLSTLEKKYEDFRIEYATRLVSSSPQTIRDYMLGKKTNADLPTVVEYIDSYYVRSVQSNSQLASGTKINYRKAIKHFKEFLNYRGLNDLGFEDLNNSVAFGFRDYLLNAIPDLKKIGMTEPSALGNIKKFRTIFDRAVDEDLLSKNPFKKIRLKNKSPQRDRLDIHQVKLLYNLNFLQIPSQELYRDIFLFSAFTGLAFNDLMNLMQSNLTGISGVGTKLSVKRVKTDISTEMVLPRHAIAIMEKYKSNPEIHFLKRVFPKRSNKEVNIQLKVLAGLANIQIRLTTHIGRHTFRQLLAEAGISDIGVIKQMMGHSSKSNIDGIYHQVTLQSLFVAKEKFELFLNKHLL